MIIEVARKITNLLIKECVIDKTKREVYTYGMELLISTVLSTATIIVLGITLHRLSSTLFLLIPFYCIRVYAGGIHAESYAVCILTFTLEFLSVLLGVEYLMNIGYQDWIMVLSIASTTIICLISPVEDHSRPLNLEERKQYKRKTCIVTISYMAISQIMYKIFNFTQIVYVGASINTILMVLLAGVIKNKLIGYHSTYV